MSGPSAAHLAIAAAGAAIVLAALVDLFVTVFNYEGFSLLANRLHGALRYPVVYYFQPAGWRGRSRASSRASAGSWRCCAGACRRGSR